MAEMYSGKNQTIKGLKYFASYPPFLLTLLRGVVCCCPERPAETGGHPGHVFPVKPDVVLFCYAPADSWKRMNFMLVASLKQA